MWKIPSKEELLVQREIVESDAWTGGPSSAGVIGLF